MARHPNICVFVFVVVFTTIANYGHSFKSKPVVMPPRQPQYLFPPHLSVVLDSSRGSLEPLVKRLQEDEFVFVMFYAPWCSKSLAARSEFEKAAVMLQNKVTFAAVNCWWPEGDCSKRYKFLIFPAFIAYHTSLEGYKYTGASRADHFIRFVENLIHPVSLVHTLLDVQDKIARHDSLVLGYFNLTGKAHVGSYMQFYYASMRIQEKDPLQPIHFALTSNSSLGGTFQLAEQSIILIRAKQVTVTYPFRDNITCSNIVNWALQAKGKPAVSRLVSTGLKSQALAREINQGPAIIVFHHENRLFNVEQGLRVLKDVALQYQSCLLGKDFKNLYLNWRKLSLNDHQKLDRISEMCNMLQRPQSLQKKFIPCCSTVVVNKLKKSWYSCEVCQIGDHQMCSSSIHNDVDYLFQNVRLLTIATCSSMAPSYHQPKEYNVCCHNRSDHASGIKWAHERQRLQYGLKKFLNDLSQGDGVLFVDLENRRITDRYYLDKLIRLPLRLCGRMSFTRLNSPAHPNVGDESVYSIEPQLARELKTMGCKTNRSLNFFSMDSQNHWMVMDRLGIDKKMAALSPSVVIFDRKVEEHYIMKENFTLSNTMSFIMDFQKGNLKRHQNSHSFNTCASGYDKKGQVCIPELDSKTFLSAVRAENKDVVVLIYAHWCGFCKSLSHTFLALAQYFSTSKYISFMRINGATNDLPWEYTVDSYPKILFFSAHRKPDSIMFPSDKDKTLINLIRFVLSHSTYDTRLLLASDVCSKSCIQNNLHRSKDFLQKLSLKYRRLLVSIENIAHMLSDASKSNSYLRFSYEFLRQSLTKLSERMRNVKILIGYLESNVAGSIDKNRLMTLFQDNRQGL